jgi:hypothetical protein
LSNICSTAPASAAASQHGREVRHDTAEVRGHHLEIGVAAESQELPRHRGSLASRVLDVLHLRQQVVLL